MGSQALQLLGTTACDAVDCTVLTHQGGLCEATSAVAASENDG